MEKSFEDIFSECQVDMIHTCMKYVDFREEVEAVFVYTSKEDRVLGWDWFYKIKGKIIPKEKTNDALGGQRPFSQKSTGEGLDPMLEDIFEIQRACQEYGREMPTEMKIIYDTKTHRVNADYNYEPLIHDNPNLPWNGFGKWRDEEAARLGQVIK